ncbi:HlyD family secretion protein [Fibrella aquatilis]|uniref:HlyD family efflux transporter periplasmic adaptor subunit n=1 Tax=Fibrella aquatilis TaxID=2817059 RepID=A0A939G4I2_9BACT|nr:HlyD family efflux transporter periplasmic adaptor subunit [Fibrella aquatilis]MBO0931954.1 HlyD family efflux transporter periplasmic adaptor subunit [Fibrella aquatilis]
MPLQPTYTLIFLAASTLFVACQKEEKPQQNATPAKPITQVVGVARVEPERGLINLYAGADGRVTTINVSENQALTSGQVLLTVDSQTDKAQVAQARSKIGTQRAAIAAQEATISTLRLAVEQAQADVELNRKLLAVKGITEQTLRDSEATLATRQQDYRKGQADLQQTRAVVTELNADVNSALVGAKDKTLRAPYTGKLLDWTVKIGDFVTGNTQVGQMAPNGSLIARTEVDELFAERIKPGQRANIRSQATGKIIGSGTVYFAADFLKKKSLFEDETAQEDRRVREVRIRLNPGANVLINSRVDCIILLN